MAGFNKMGCILTAFLGFMFLQLCSATRYYDWVLKEKKFTRLCSTKSILTVNGGFPGPAIQVHKGETIYVNIRNQGLYGVTIHWHGVKQPRNPWSDGPENITQCPIQPGSNFTYEVVFSSEEGTLWWHAHSDWTRATVHGAMVVLPAAGTTYPFATPYAQQTIILASWFKADVMEVITSALATGADPNTSDAFTINGQPGDLYSCSKASTYRLLVDYGKTYMLRIINAIMNEEQFFAIANHNLTVVTQDASYIKPITTPYIMITPGQTMDVLVTTNQPRSHYYMASTAYNDGDVPYHNGTTTAILQYRGNYSTPSTTPLPNLPIHNDTTAADNFTARVKSLASKAHPISVPTNITTRIYMTVSINERICANASCAGPNNNAIAASLNNISFDTPSIDILQAYYRGINGVFQGNFPSNPPLFFNFTGEVVNSTKYPTFATKVKFLKYGEGVEIIFQGTNLVAPENHPMHLHGFSFYLVGTGYGNFNKATSPKTYNLVDPPEVNTIGVPKNGWATIRFVADNPGVWFMHCHLERHASWGMDTVFIVRNGNTEESKLRPLSSQPKPPPRKRPTFDGGDQSPKPTSRNRHKRSYGASRRSILKTLKQEQVTFTTPVPDDPIVGIIGGGMAGLACALYLEKRGVRSTVFDTGVHGLGGRMGTRIVDPQPLIFDHAAQFFTASNPLFVELVQGWMEQGLVREWQGTIGELEVGGKFVPLPSPPPRYIGVNGMRPVADSLLSQSSMINVERPTWISKLEPFNGTWYLSENGKPRGQFDAIVIAHNGKCANRLLGSSGLPLIAGQMKRLELSSVWALLAAFEDPLQIPGTDTFPFEGAFVKGVDSISWMANNTKKLLGSQSGGPHCWTFLSTAAYGKRNKVPQENIPTATKEKVTAGMLMGVEEALGLPKGSLQTPFYTRLQLWGAALPTNTPGIPCIFDPHGRAGICGDWLLGSNLESAAISGMALANHMADYFQSGGDRPEEFSVGLRSEFQRLKGHDIGQFPGLAPVSETHTAPELQLTT